MLGKSQNTEEVQQDDDCDNGAEGKIIKFSDDHILPWQLDFSASTRSFGQRVTTIIHAADALPLLHVADVLSPPPDACKS